MRTHSLVILLALGFGTVSPALAQRAPADRIGLRGLATFGVSQLDAADSFEAVFGSSTLSDWGAGGQVTNLWRGLFAEVTFGRSEEAGERVFVDGSTVYQLGIPVTLTMNTLDVTAGYRFLRGARVVPYVGGGYTSVAYQESSPFAQAGDDLNDRFGGFVVTGGVELRTFDWLHVRGEARYRQIPDALGAGGVSQEYGEDSLGGLRLGVLVAVGR